MTPSPLSEVYARYRNYELLVDSRRLIDPARTLFFALPGTRRDGHEFVGELYARGVRHFVVSRVENEYADAHFLVVDDPLNYLQELVAHHRRQFDIPVLGITGSNGKTTVKEWLYEVLSPHFRVVRSPRSYNSQIGVPLSVWRLREEHELAIFEAGISRPGEMVKLEHIIQPTVGLFTNLGSAHDEGFPDRAAKLAEKFHLFSRVRKLLYTDQGQPEVQFAVQSQSDQALRCWSRTDPEATLFVARQPFPEDPQRYPALYRGEEEMQLRLPFRDEQQNFNALHVYLAARELGLDHHQAQAGLERLHPLGLRLETLAGREGCHLLNDSYNNDLTSLGATLVYARQLHPDEPKTLILSALPEEKLRGGELYAQLSQLLTGRVDRLFTVGAQLAELGAYLNGAIPTQHYPDTAALLRDLSRQTFRQELIILKGARRFGFERLADRLAAQVHRTELTIDLDALAHNLGRFRARLDGSTRLAVMVKASAYGSGSVPVARRLQEERADYLFVAYADEGADLRRAGIRLPIAVLNPEPPAFELLAQYDLEPEVHSWTQLRELVEYFTDRRQVGIHLKIDTGMARLGFDAGAAAKLGAFLRERPRFSVCSVFTHLVAAEAAEHDAFTEEQVARFKTAYAEFCASYGAAPPRHVLNSAGILRFPQYQYEMVRLGIGLYGVQAEGFAARTVLSLRARVAQIRDLLPGATVGYGRRGSLPEGGRIAVLSIGYADGLPRAVGRGRFAPLIHGRPAPIVGEVCMDLCMVDVTHIPAVRPGDTALFFGPELPVEELARAAGTIPYEILTGIGSRVHRRYLSE